MNKKQAQQYKQILESLKSKQEARESIDQQIKELRGRNGELYDSIMREESKLISLYFSMVNTCQHRHELWCQHENMNPDRHCTFEDCPLLVKVEKYSVTSYEKLTSKRM